MSKRLPAALFASVLAASLSVVVWSSPSKAQETTRKRAHRAAVKREPRPPRALGRAGSPGALPGDPSRRHPQAPRPGGGERVHLLAFRQGVAQLPPVPEPRPVRPPLRPLHGRGGSRRLGAAIRRPRAGRGDPEQAHDPTDGPRLGHRSCLPREPRRLQAAGRPRRLHDQVTAEHLGSRVAGCGRRHRPQRPRRGPQLTCHLTGAPPRDASAEANRGAEERRSGPVLRRDKGLRGVRQPHSRRLRGLLRDDASLRPRRLRPGGPHRRRGVRAQPAGRHPRLQGLLQRAHDRELHRGRRRLRHGCRHG